VSEFLPYLDDESLSKALLWALQYGKAETAAYILENSKVDVNRIVENKTAIHIAAWSHDLISIRNLIDHGADVKLALNDGYNFFFSSIGDHQPSVSSTPFQTFLHFSTGYPVPIMASPEDSFEILKIFVDAGCDLNEKDCNGQTAFHYILNGCRKMPTRISQEIIQYMFANGADSSILTKDGSTALHLMPCHLDSAIKSLVAGGIDVNSRRRSDGRTPLFGAVGSEKYISMFVKLGADSNIQDFKGNTPLHIAVQGLEFSATPEHNAAIKALLATGADPKLKNKAGLAPIHTINNWRTHKETLLVLMKTGASLESRTDAGRTVLLSCLKGQTCYEWDIQTLLDVGADINARDFTGKTVLHYCCEKADGLDLLLKLVDAGADPSVCDYAGNTLFHQAAREGPSHYEKKQLAILEKILDLGVDPQAVNHAGQTPIHIAIGNRSSMSHYKTDPLEFLLGPKCNVDINAPDHLGIRAIHLAATLGEGQVKQLLKKGADPTVFTLEGQTALHVASRSRQCNTVGLLTDIYLKEGKAEMVDQVDEEGRTALHYAVRSGRPESVAILIDIGGADLNAKDSKGLTPLHMSTDIKQEDTHWKPEFFVDQREAYIATAGVTLKDPYRAAAGRAMVGRDSPASCREIIKFLISHGADTTVRNSTNLRKGSRGRTSLLAHALKTDSEVLVDELLDIEKNNPLPEPAPELKPDMDEGDPHDWLWGQAPPIDQFQEKYSSSRIQNTDFLDGMVTPGQNNPSLFQSLLSKDHEKGVLKMKALGADMLRPNPMGESCLTTLIKGGYASLLEHFGEEITRMDEEWIREIEKTDVNLPGRLSLPILIASQRLLPNLEVLKVLVGNFGVDVNVQFGPSWFYSYNEGKTALHILASCTQWWHTHALKYLLENGANPNIQDKEGNTPLHIAVKSSSDIAVSHLLSHGANPNLLNNDGLTTITASSSSSSIIALLVLHGADLLAGAKPFIFTCIEAQDLPTIRLLVSMDANLNVKLPPVEEPPLASDGDSDLPRLYRRKVWTRWELKNREAAENSFPVHFAAGTGFNTEGKRGKMIPIIETLLQGGADPKLAFNDEGDGIISDICVRGGILAPFLQIPDLDLEVRDSKGRTLLLCACTTDENWHDHGVRSRSLPSDVSLLLERGADITAVDNEGRNVLYHLLTSSASNKHAQAHHPSDLDTILAHPLASQLVVQKDNDGTTSLQHALKMGQFGAVDALLAKGADPLAADGEGNTALHYLAAQAKGEDFINLTFLSCLFEDESRQDANLNGRDISKPSLITSLFTKFAKFGVDINARNKAGETCLFGFVCIKEIGVFHIKFFEENGSDFTIVNAKGEGLLHACAKGGESPAWAYLSERISQVFEDWDETSGTVREGAGVRGYKGVNGKAGLFKWLMEVKGLDPLAEDRQSRSALDVATASGCAGILELFRRKDN
jgi:ankyrin repeat protein